MHILEKNSKEEKTIKLFEKLTAILNTKTDTLIQAREIIELPVL
jgi:hypothetical protein